jgi:hypothetical protein
MAKAKDEETAPEPESPSRSDADYGEPFPASTGNHRAAQALTTMPKA